MPPTKPGRWAVSPADIDTRFLHLWRGLIAVFPLWEGSGVPYEIIGHSRPTVNGDPAWIPTPSGLGIAFDGSGDSYSYPDDDRLKPVHTSMFAYARCGNSLVDPVLYGKEFLNPWLHIAYLRDGFGGLPRFTYTTAGGIVDLDGSTDMPDTNGGIHSLAGTYDGTTGRVYVDGLEEASSTAQSGDLSTTADTPTLGDVATANGSNEFPGDLYCVYVWDRALSATEVRLLAWEPTGV